MYLMLVPQVSTCKLIKLNFLKYIFKLKVAWVLGQEITAER